MAYHVSESLFHVDLISNLQIQLSWRAQNCLQNFKYLITESFPFFYHLVDVHSLYFFVWTSSDFANCQITKRVWRIYRFHSLLSSTRNPNHFTVGVEHTQCRRKNYHKNTSTIPIAPSLTISLCLYELGTSASIHLQNSL